MPDTQVVIQADSNESGSFYQADLPDGTLFISQQIKWANAWMFHHLLPIGKDDSQSLSTIGLGNITGEKALGFLLEKLTALGYEADLSGIIPDSTPRLYPKKDIFTLLKESNLLYLPG